MGTALSCYLDAKAEIEEKIRCLKDSIVLIDGEIDSIVGGGLTDVRIASGKTFGVVSVLHDGIDVKETVGKKIKWDQDLMASFAEKLRQSDEPIDRYMVCKYSIPEKKFAEFPASLKHLFSEARTVMPGTTKLTFKRREE